MVPGLNRAIPIIAIQLGAFEVEGKVVLHFAKLLDLAEPAADEEQEQVEAQRDRAYWERKANPASLGIMDKLISLVPAGTRTTLKTKAPGATFLSRTIPS